MPTDCGKLAGSLRVSHSKALSSQVSAMRPTPKSTKVQMGG